jgi:tRNA dimethylallyltransferase
MRQEKKIIILLAGPTAAGKSKLAIKLARHFNGEIINADSMQIYKEISILTSKPGYRDTKAAKHHLYGFNSVKKKFSTGHWLKMVIKKIKEQWKNNKTPIVVGGTGLYFKVLTDGLVRIPTIPHKVRITIRELHKKIGQKNFYLKLIKLDPLAKRFVSESDPQRSIRAYEVKKFTNKSLFDFIKDTKLNFSNKVFKKIFINIPKELLNKKIEKRVEKMFNNGAIKEVNLFFKMKVNKELSSNKIIGINEIKDYLDGKITIIKAKELIAQKTRQYAKRQFTWSRGHMSSWEMIYSPNSNDLLNKAINKIS